MVLITSGIDFPKNCAECDFCTTVYKDKHYCNVIKEMFNCKVQELQNSRDERCPLVNLSRAANVSIEPARRFINNNGYVKVMDYDVNLKLNMRIDEVERLAAALKKRWDV